jgi:anti-sigma factor RsiW
MNEPFNDELISAYLDGELSPDEQACVEQTLVESAEFRQMFEELRALRGDLQILPGHRLPGDFSERVLQRAEQAMLREAHSFVPAESASNNGQPAEVNEPASAPVSAPLVELPSQPGQWSGVVWAFAALAAALLVALYLPYLPGIDSERVAMETRKTADQVVKDPNVRDMATPGQMVAPAETEGSKNIASNMQRKVDGKNAGGRETPVELEGALPGLKLPLKEQSAPPAVADVHPENKVPAPVAAPPAPPGPAVAAKADQAPREPDPTAALKPVAEGLAKQREEIDPRFVVVRLQATREALDSGAFDGLLRKRNIRFEEADALQDEKAIESLRQKRRTAEQVSAEGVDVVFVEATVAQIDGVLADLQARPDRFLGVAGQLLAEDSLDAAATNQYYSPFRDARANGVSRLESNAKPAGKDVQDGVKSEEFSAKSGEAKAALDRGAGAGGSPARAFAPGGPGGAAPRGGAAPPAPGLPTVPEKPKAEMAAKKATEGDAGGFASRVAPPTFRGRLDRLELAKSAELGDQDAAKLLKLRALGTFEDDRSEKESAEKKPADKRDSEIAKQARFAEGVARERKELLDRYAVPPERVRVLFVIRAVEQDSPARPER